MEMNGEVLLLLTLWIFLAVMTGSMAATKNRSRAVWTVLAALFGVAALILLFLLDARPAPGPEVGEGQTRKEGWVVSIPYGSDGREKTVLASLKELSLPVQLGRQVIDVGPLKDRKDALQLRTRLIDTYAIQGKLDWKTVVS